MFKIIVTVGVLILFITTPWDADAGKLMEPTEAKELKEKIQSFMDDFFANDDNKKRKIQGMVSQAEENFEKAQAKNQYIEALQGVLEHAQDMYNMLDVEQDIENEASGSGTGTGTS